MNLWTKLIAEHLNVDIPFARRVQDIIDRQADFDYSECTMEEFKSAAHDAMRTLEGTT